MNTMYHVVCACVKRCEVAAHCSSLTHINIKCMCELWKANFGTVFVTVCVLSVNNHLPTRITTHSLTYSPTGNSLCYITNINIHTYILNHGQRLIIIIILYICIIIILNNYLMRSSIIKVVLNTKITYIHTYIHKVYHVFN